MEGAKIASVFGIVFLIAALLMIAGGVLLIVFSILKTIRGEKRIGRIVGGGILTFFGLIGFIYGIMFLILGSVANSQAMDQNTLSMMAKTVSALTNKESEQLADLCAKESYSGDEISWNDTIELFEYIDGDVRAVSNEVYGTAFQNDTTNITFKYIVYTKDGDEYVIMMDCITEGDDEYVGIQHIKMSEDGDKICEYGAKPKLS